MKKPSRLARHIFRPLIDANGPASLDLAGVDPDLAFEAIREVAELDLVRVCDGPDPLSCQYVLVSGASGAFLSPWEKMKRRISMWLGFLRMTA